jgi:hypothetical protein
MLLTASGHAFTFIPADHIIIITTERSLVAVSLIRLIIADAILPSIAQKSTEVSIITIPFSLWSLFNLPNHT